MDLFIDFLKNIPNKVLVDSILLRLKVGELEHIITSLVNTYGLNGLVKLLPKKEYLFVSEKAAEIMEEITIEEAEKLFNSYHESI